MKATMMEMSRRNEEDGGCKKPRSDAGSDALYDWGRKRKE
jgi:hypothetical protein